VAEAAVDRLARAPGDDTELSNITLLRLRALLLRPLGDEVVYRELTGRYRAMAISLGFEGHIAWAEALP